MVLASEEGLTVFDFELAKRGASRWGGLHGSNAGWRGRQGFQQRTQQRSRAGPDFDD